jgi:sugar/nucleoside kinase (ribokinase family)
VVGDDENGSFILSHLESRGVNIDAMRRAPGVSTSYTDVMTVESTGKRTFFHHYGANALLCEEDFALEKLHSRILHLGYLTLLERLDAPDPANPERTCAAAILERARSSGLETSIDIVTDLAPRLQQVVPSALKHVDYFIANEWEAGGVTGIALRSGNGEFIRQNLDAAADALFGMGVHKLVVIHAPEGGFWKSRAGFSWFQPSLDVPASFVRGTAGAGDAFCAGALYGIHEGWDAEKSMQLAAANAAQSLSDPTCTAGLCGLEETLGLIDRLGFRAN